MWRRRLVTIQDFGFFRPTCKTIYTTTAKNGAAAENCTLISSLPRRRSAVDLQRRIVLRDQVAQLAIDLLPAGGRWSCAAAGRGDERGRGCSRSDPADTCRGRGSSPDRAGGRRKVSSGSPVLMVRDRRLALLLAD
jgi:hypothetical protein